MSSKGGRRTRERTPQGPSPFFIIAIVLGLILFIWLFNRSASRSAAPAAPPPSTSS